jgi:hypothetical protein
MHALTAREAGMMIEARCGYTTDALTGCWLYIAAQGREEGPWAAFYAATYAPPGAGLVIVHTCAGRGCGCVNPAHMNVIPVGSEHTLLPPVDPATHAEDFAHRLRDEIAARRMSPEDFAWTLSLSAMAVRSWVAGGPIGAGERVEVERKLGWDGVPRKWVATAVVQHVSTCDSAGAAARALMDRLCHDGRVAKVSFYDVRPAGEPPNQH